MSAKTVTSVPPNQTLYIQNLNEKLQKPDLRRELYMLFSTYGPILDITALKTKSMRGQAHVLFRDVDTATRALRAQNGEEFFGREMRISYSKNRSDTLAKLTGTFAPPASAAQPAAPGSSIPAPPGSLPPPPGLKVPAAGTDSASPAPSQGTKRGRDESDEEDEAEDEGAMDMSDDDD